MYVPWKAYGLRTPSTFTFSRNELLGAFGNSVKLYVTEWQVMTSLKRGFAHAAGASTAVNANAASASTATRLVLRFPLLRRVLPCGASLAC